MLRTIMAATAVSALALSSAMAQSTPPASPSTAPSVTAPSATGSARFVVKQEPDQWLASKFKGTDVVGTNDEKIGDVADILFDKNGSIIAYIVGVGGFLGIGAKDVAIAPASFQLMPGQDPSDYKLRLSMTKDELKTAATFEPYSPPRPAVSSNPNGQTRPMGAPAPTRPSTSTQ